MKYFHQILDRPTWRTYLLLLALHYAAIQISFFCGKTAENEVIIWLPNSVLLVALLRFRGEGGLVMAAITFATNVISNLPTASLSESALLSAINLLEIGMTYQIMRYVDASPQFTQVKDFAKFVISGPLLSAFISGLLGAAVIFFYDKSTSYLTLMRVWWFCDGLGMLIFTPLLMLAIDAPDEHAKFEISDVVILLFTIGLLSLMFIARGEEITALTPTLLIPVMLVLAMRFGVFWSALGIALVSLAMSRMVAVGIRPFGEADFHHSIIHTQEFILTLSVICMGAAALRSELRAHERDLEDKVRDRTADLSASLAQLNNAQAELVQSEKLASLGALVTGVSHELNSPIGVAVTVASSLQNRMEQLKKELAGEKLRRSELNHFFDEGIEMVALLDRSVHRASDLIESFKQIAVDRTSESRRIFNLLKLVEDIEGIWKIGHEYRSINIVANIPAHIECDSYPGPLGQIVSNLIQNAAVHAFADQANSAHINTFHINAATTEKEVTITFADNGKGMDASTLARIFDPFFTTRLGQGGSGLGLSICRNIAVGLLGGSLGATSELGRGTVLKLTFLRKAPS